MTERNTREELLPWLRMAIGNPDIVPDDELWLMWRHLKAVDTRTTTERAEYLEDLCWNQPRKAWDAVLQEAKDFAEDLFPSDSPEDNQ